MKQEQVVLFKCDQVRNDPYLSSETSSQRVQFDPLDLN